MDRGVCWLISGLRFTAACCFSSTVCLPWWLFDCVLWLWSADKSLLAPTVMNRLLWAEKAGNPVIWWEVSSHSWTIVCRVSWLDLLDIGSIFLSRILPELQYNNSAKTGNLTRVSRVNRTCDLLVFYQRLQFTHFWGEKSDKSKLTSCWLKLKLSIWSAKHTDELKHRILVFIHMHTPLRGSAAATSNSMFCKIILENRYNLFLNKIWEKSIYIRT